MYPDFAIENSLGITIGVDEAGRGPLAGPVVAAAIILDKSAASIGINDSKKLSHAKREHIYKILTRDFEYKVSFVDHQQIDEINILNATMLAMKQVMEGLEWADKSVLIDGNRCPIKADNVLAVVKGDAKSLSIAAASIIAKVERDRYMESISQDYPQYGWEQNYGYGTKTHIEALRKFGPCEFHRQSFLKKLSLNLHAA